MFHPSPGLRHQVSTNTLVLTTTNKCPEGHEKGETQNSSTWQAMTGVQHIHATCDERNSKTG